MSDTRNDADDKTRPKKKASSWKRSCLGCFLGLSALVLIIVGIVFLVCDHHYNLRSNLVYVEFNSSYNKPLQIKVPGKGWEKLDDLNGPDIQKAAKLQFNKQGYRWRTIRIRRTANFFRERAINLVSPCEVHVIEFDPEHFTIKTAFDRMETGRFRDLTAKEVKRKLVPDSVFAINASYFEYKKGGAVNPMGMIVSDGEQIIPRRPAWSGFFFVKDNQPWFGPTSLFEETPGELTEALQGYPSVMKDGTIFSYLNTTKSSGKLNRFFNGKELTFRSLAAVKKDGTIMFVVSGQGGLLNMGETCKLAHALEAEHATLLDGGRALQYEFRRGGHRQSFHAFNNTLEHEGKFAPVRPPVYLVVTPRPN